MKTKLRCRLGVHKYEQSRPLVIMDIFPPFYLPYETPRRACSFCSKKQYWLPGYGGSEIGSWEPLREAVEAKHD